MSLQASGQISASQIRNEFGATSGTSVSFGAYRISQTVSALTNMPLDAGIPQSGQIKFSDFYAKELNVVVDYTSPSIITKVTGRTDYDANNSRVVVIGGFKTRPVNPAGTKVWIHTNGDVGSDVPASSANQTYCSLLTGSWDVTTDLRVDIGPSGRIFGSGGSGGQGGSVSGRSITANPTAGGNGTSSIGVNATNSTIINIRGIIQCGGGGGGGSAGAWGFTHDPRFQADQYSVSGGSGGGGGAGYPAGSGGIGGSADAPYRTTAFTPGSNGSNGTITLGGNGGNGVGGGNNRGEGVSATGGGGAGGPNGTGGNGISATGNPGNPYPQYSTITSLPGENGTATSGGTGGRSEGVGAFAHNYFGVNGAALAPDNPGTTGAPGGADGYAIVVNSPSGSVTITNNGTIVGVTTYSTIPV